MGLGAYSFAQTPLSLPALPPLPNGTNASSAAPTLPLPVLPASAAEKTPAITSTATPSLPVPALDEAPILADLPKPDPDKSSASKTSEDLLAIIPKPAATPSAVPDPLPAAVEGGDTELKDASQDLKETTAADIPAPPPSLMLTPPPLSGGEPTNSMPPLAQSKAEEATELPEISIAPEKPRLKTWKTTLAPSIIPPETKFHYRRQILPSTIYRKQYEEFNAHLPSSMTRQDYENLLFVSVTRNDIQSIRSLLNAGTDINAVDASGATPLRVAQAVGANAAAQLLIARGAR